MIVHPIPSNIPWLHERTVLFVTHGSHAYGLDTPESDWDYKGVCIPPKAYFHGFLRQFEQAECHKPDSVIYEIRKFFKLAADCNPNIIELLWCADEHYHTVPNRSARCVGNSLLGLREQFLSQKAKHTFSGYALAQLKRIRAHRRWLLNPPTHKPERKEFHLPETALLSKDMMGAIAVTIERTGESEFTSNVMEKYHQERAYHNALTEWHQYCNWQKTRNVKRAELEAKFGYDCKHAMHLVRLLRMCREILTQGHVIVKRPDREELLAIRNGAWAYDQLVEWAEQEDAELTEIAKQSVLPRMPDRELLDLHCKLMVERMLE